MMDTLEKELHNIGFSDVFIKEINRAENFDTLDLDIANVGFQTYENEIVSTTELEVTNTPTSYTNFVIGIGTETNE